MFQRNTVSAKTSTQRGQLQVEVTVSKDVKINEFNQKFRLEEVLQREQQKFCVAKKESDEAVRLLKEQLVAKNEWISHLVICHNRDRCDWDIMVRSLFRS